MFQTFQESLPYKQGNNNLIFTFTCNIWIDNKNLDSVIIRDSGIKLSIIIPIHEKSTNRHSGPSSPSLPNPDRRRIL